MTALLVLAAAVDARADVVYNDTVSPDISNVWNAPTSINLPFGTSTVIFRTRLDENSITDVDIFRINLPLGGALQHLVLSSFEGDSGTSFISLQEGVSLTFDPVATGGNECAEQCLGYSHLGPNEAFRGMGVGDDILVGNSEMSGLDDSRAPSFFTTPLFGTNYTFWAQEFNGDVTMHLDFVVPPVFGDYNHDGETNAADYTVWRNSLGTTVVAGLGADGNGDGSITDDDYAIWKTNYGTLLSGSGGGSAVPEPSSVLLLVSSLFAAGTRRRSRNPS